MEVTFKTCTQCGVEKPCSEFYGNSRGGLRTNCKDCGRAAQKLRPNRTREQRAEYSRRVGRTSAEYRTKEQILADAAQKKAARESEREERRKARAQVKAVAKTASRGGRGSWEWRRTATEAELAAWRSEARERWRRHYLLNAMAERQRTKAYKISHPETVSRWHRDRQARLDQQRDGTLTDAVVAAILGAAGYCSYCGSKMIPEEKTLDHVVALSRGGWHSISNVAACCSACNASKGAKPLDEWLEQRRAEGLPVAASWQAHPSRAGEEQRLCAMARSTDQKGTSDDPPASGALRASMKSQL